MHSNSETITAIISTSCHYTYTAPDNNKHCITLHPLYTKNKEQPKLGAQYSNSRSIGLLKHWVVVRVACLPLPVQP